MLKRLLHIGGLTVGSALFIYLGFKLFQNFDQVLASLAKAPIGFFPAAIALYGLGILFITLSWIGTVHWLGGKLNLSRGLKIYGLAGIGKYIPGNIAQHIGRVTLCSREGVPVKIVVGSIFLEFILASLAALLLGLPKILMDSRTLRVFSMERVGFVIFAGLFVLSLFIWIKRHKIQKFEMFSYRKMGAIDMRTFVINFGLMISGFIFLSGLCSWVAFNIVGANRIVFLDFALAFPIAWLAGYLAPGAPAGLGAREFVLVVLLGHQYGEARVIASSFILRFITSFGDLLIFLSALTWKIKDKKL